MNLAALLLATLTAAASGKPTIPDPCGLIRAVFYAKSPNGESGYFMSRKSGVKLDEQGRARLIAVIKPVKGKERPLLPHDATCVDADFAVDAEAPLFTEERAFKLYVSPSTTTQGRVRIEYVATFAPFVRNGTVSNFSGGVERGSADYRDKTWHVRVHPPATTGGLGSKSRAK